jgi:methylamine--corrinoid protein Co-methyltransferase
MSSLVHLIKMLQRAKEGPACTVREWEMERIPQTVKKYLEKYDLAGTFNKDEPVNQDLEMANQYYEAGVELALEMGLLCPETETVIKVSRDELLTALNDLPLSFTLGKGDQQVEFRTRHPEDPHPPVFCGPLCIQVSEEMYVPIAAGILRSKRVRVQEGPSLDTVFGYPVYSGTPFETVVGLLENQLRQEAQWRAGREGMPNMSIASSTTEYGQLGAFPGETSKDNPSFAIILHPAEMKIGFPSFHKAAVAIGYGSYYYSGSTTMIGGYAGGAEGCALSNIATVLLQFPILQANAPGCSIYDIRTDSTCSRHALWALSIVEQAIGGNTWIPAYKVINQSAGPCTPEILYTSAAGLITAGVSGMAYTVGPRSAGGRFKDYLTPLEHWFCADVFEASAQLNLSQANELVLYLLSRYEDSLKNPPRGKSFQECFNIRTGEPGEEWRRIDQEVRADLESRGMKLDPIIY